MLVALMKIGVLFELGLHLRNKGTSSESPLAMTRGKVPFDSIAFHQCPNPFSNAWAWGELIWDISTRPLWDKSSKIWLAESDVDYVCFEDAYFDVRYGTWLGNKQILAAWRAAAASHLRQPVLSNMDEEITVGDSKRIKIYQRSSVTARRFVNLADVTALVQQFTVQPVEVFTTNENTSIFDQISAFQDIDILVTPHGSHIANIIFSPLRLKILEVIPVVRDPVFQRNAQEMAFAGYEVSIGHNISASCPYAREFENSCTIIESTSSRIIECDPKVVSKVTQCDIVVDLELLKNDLEELLGIGRVHPAASK